MATSNQGKGGQAKVDPRRELQQTIAQLISSGALTAQTANSELAMKLQGREDDYQSGLAELQRKRAAGFDDDRRKDIQKRATKFAQLVAQGRKAELQTDAKMRAQQPQGPTPQELVDQAVSGTETENIQPLAPTTRGPSDAAGGQALAAIQSLGQPGGPQPGSPVAGMPQGASADQALAAALGGGGGGPSVQMGGQTFQAPETITRQVSELGAQVMPNQWGWSMAPTFNARTITEPNVLTAGDIADLTAKKQQAIINTGLALYQDSENAPMPAAMEAAQGLLEGDLQKAVDFGTAYPSLGRQAARLEMDAMRASTAADLAAARAKNMEGDYYQSLLDSTNNASDWGPLFGLPSAGGGGVGGRAGLRGAGGAAPTTISKVDLGNLVMKEGDVEINDHAWFQVQKETAAKEGTILYRLPKGGMYGAAVRKLTGEDPAFREVSAAELITNWAYATEGTKEQEQEALAYFKTLPFMHVEDPKLQPDGTYSEPIISVNSAYEDAGASLLASRMLRTVKAAVVQGQKLPDWMVDPLTREQMIQLKRQAGELPPVPTKKAAPDTPLSPYEVGLNIRTSAGFMSKVLREAPKELVRQGIASGYAVRRGTVGVARGVAGLPETPAKAPRAPLVGPERLPVGEPIPTATPTRGPRQAEMRAARPKSPTVEERAQPTGPIGPAGRVLTAREVMQLRALGFPLEVIRTMPASMVAEVLGAAASRQMPPQIRALVPRGMMPSWPPPRRPAR